MCRYGFSTYKPHFGCFKCRKVFKQPAPLDLLKRDDKLARYEQLRSRQTLSNDKQMELDEINRDYYDREIKCPECGSLMADLGLDFKAPRKTDIKHWKIIEGLYTIGYSFHSCGCSGPGFIPKDKIAYREYLSSVLTDYRDQLIRARNMESQIKDKDQRVKYWAEKTRLIEHEFTKID
jgi:hypothetical protein